MNGDKSLNTNNYSLPELGWRPVLQMQLSLKDLEIGLLARVIAVHRSQLLVLSEQGELQVPLTGVLTDEDPESRASTGDWLLLDRVNLKPLRLLERMNAIKRQAAGTEVRTQMIAANIDTLFLVTSCNQDFNLSRLERYLSIALNARIPAVIVLTKADLCPPEEADKLKDQATKLSSDVPVLSLDAHSSSVPEIFSAWTGRGETIAFLGSSGVGKSTLTNQLTGQFSQKTNQIREQDAKGRHTTTERSMHRIPGGGWILDTPGMREIKLGADAGCLF